MQEQADRPLTRATERLFERLSAAGVPVRLEHPADAGEVAGLVVCPIALVPEAMPAGNGTPLRIRVRYLVCANGSAAAALDLLDRVLTTEQPYLVPDEVPESVWQTVGARHRVGLLFEVPVNVSWPRETAPRVTALPRIVGVSLRDVSGRVVAPGGVPLAGMRVAAADGTASTHTDVHGHFTLPGVQADQPLRLLVTGRGLRLAAEVAAVTTEPVLITCEVQ